MGKRDIKEIHGNNLDREVTKGSDGNVILGKTKMTLWTEALNLTVQEILKRPTVAKMR